MLLSYGETHITFKILIIVLIALSGRLNSIDVDGWSVFSANFGAQFEEYPPPVVVILRLVF